MFTILVFFCMACFVGVFGQDPPCTGRDQCSCITADGKIIDLTSVGHNDGTAAFPDVQSADGYMYSYNPCYPFSELNCADQSVCQVPSDKSTSYQAGDANSAVFSNDGTNNHILYSSTGGDGVTRSSDVTLICDTGATTPSFQAVGEQPGGSIYYMSLTTKCACPDGCNGDTPPGPGPGPNKDGSSSGLSIGSILVIAFVSLSFVYLIGGIIIMKFVKKASGKDVIPNSGFWASVPGNARNGVTFVYCKVRGREFTAYSSI